MITLSKEKMLEQYGDFEVKFISYYKYVFYYEGTKDNLKIYASVGGDPDEIYKLNVSANVSYKIKELPLDYFDVEEDGKVVASYSSW